MGKSLLTWKNIHSWQVGKLVVVVGWVAANPRSSELFALLLFNNSIPPPSSSSNTCKLFHFLKVEGGFSSSWHYFFSCQWRMLICTPCGVIPALMSWIPPSFAAQLGWTPTAARPKSCIFINWEHHFCMPVPSVETVCLWLLCLWQLSENMWQVSLFKLQQLFEIVIA